MNDSKNLILASIAIIAVVLVALVLFFSKDGKNEINNNLDKVKVYIHHEKTEKEKGYYSECNLSTEDLVKVRNDFNKIVKLTDQNLLNGKKINGDYKVIVEDKFIAFDKEHDNSVYIEEYNGIYEFKGNIYDIVIKNCGS